MIEQTLFLGAVFLCGESKLENIFYGLNFCGKNFEVYLRELIFADRWKNRQKKQKKNSPKLEPAKISCHTVIDSLPRRRF